MDKKIPDILYKYRDWENNYHKDMIRKAEMFFTSAKRFNDPFDCAFPTRYDFFGENSHPKIIERMLRENNPGLSKKQIIETAMSTKSLNNDQITNAAKTANQQLQEKNYTKFGILTLSAVKSNILMWSHYSNYHKGFCIGMNTAKIKRYLEKLYQEKQIRIFPIKVEYVSEIPIFDFRSIGSEEWGIKQFSIKSSDWGYEKEWRYILAGNTDSKISIDYDIFEELIFGCKIPTSHKDDIIGIIQKWPNKLKVFQAIKKDHEFGLKLEKVEY